MVKEGKNSAVAVLGGGEKGFYTVGRENTKVATKKKSQLKNQALKGGCSFLG